MWSDTNCDGDFPPGPSHCVWDGFAGSKDGAVSPDFPGMRRVTINHFKLQVLCLWSLEEKWFCARLWDFMTAGWEKVFLQHFPVCRRWFLLFLVFSFKVERSRGDEKHRLRSCLFSWRHWNLKPCCVVTNGLWMSFFLGGCVCTWVRPDSACCHCKHLLPPTAHTRACVWVCFPCPQSRGSP